MTDTINHSLRRVAPGAVVTTVAGGPARPGGLADGAGEAARFNDPAGIAVGPRGDAFVADRGNHGIRRITPAGVVSTWAGFPDGAAGSADGLAEAAGFDRPSGIVADPLGNLYVTDTLNTTVRRIDRNQVVTHGEPDESTGVVQITAP